MSTTAGTIAIRTTGIRHARLRTTDMARARVFYLVRLGFPVVLEEVRRFVFQAGGSLVEVRGEVEGAPDARRDGGPTGLLAISLGCADGAELRRVASSMTGAGIAHSGLRSDPALGIEYLAFSDPDGIEWELCTMV